MSPVIQPPTLFVGWHWGSLDPAITPSALIQRLNQKMKALETTLGSVTRLISGSVRNWTAVTHAMTPYSPVVTDRTVGVDASAGNVVVTPPLATSVPGQEWVVVRVDASGNTATVQLAGSDKWKGGSSSFTVSGLGTVVRLQSDGTQGYWQT